MKKIQQNSLLWKITPSRGTTPSYLFGTMHVRDLRAFGWLELAQTKIDACDYFATEFDFAEADPLALAGALALPEGKSLQDFLSRGAWKHLDYFARKKLGTSAESLRNQHPMSVSTLLSTAFMAEEMSYSLDETLWNHARSLGKKTTGLETFADQLNILQRIPFDLHLKGLTWVLKNHSRQKTRLKKMMLRYANGELQALYKAAKKDAKGMRKILIYRRNNLMSQRFVEIMGTHSVFCAVGAGHLSGGKGMLRLLKKAGCRVEPIFSTQHNALTDQSTTR
jgi:uncharacterized protein